ncbi:hypothetical protein [Streptomyces sp. NPDC051561]|uniref:hypothetical protein n=1 Tax=Streptomyces sp. NPDC051561 TaxID=3365658 RepID=UPI00379F7A91
MARMNPTGEQPRPHVHSVRVKVDLTGTQRHREIAEALFEERRWKITSRPDPAVFHPVEERSARYVLELAVPEGRPRRSGRVAGQMVNGLAAEAGLALQPLEADPLWKDHEQAPVWFVCDPPKERAGGEGLGDRVKRKASNQARRMGFRDTGGVRWGSHAVARTTVAEDQSLRPPYPLSESDNDGVVRRGSVVAGRSFFQGLAAALAAGACGPWAATGSLLPLLLLCAAWWICFRRFVFLEPARPRYVCVATASLCGGFFGLTLVGSSLSGAISGTTDRG